ncbi:MAG: helix-turn-helix transcriptional regulator, partial [Clostridia bacterium]|nr:helix-turn-helix transcriptional regulator [Clostridia bacterium]
SRSTLYAMSRAAFGMGISDYIRSCRIDYAKKLLLKKELPIYEISRVCGFGAPNYFTKTFKQYVGVLPKDFCKQNRIGEE